MVLWIYIAWSIKLKLFPCRRVMFPIGCIKCRFFPFVFLPASLEWVNVPNPVFVSFSFSSSFRISNYHFLWLFQRQEFLHSNICTTKINFSFAGFPQTQPICPKFHTHIFLADRTLKKVTEEVSQVISSELQLEKKYQENCSLWKKKNKFEGQVYLQNYGV